MEYWIYYNHESLERGAWLHGSRQAVMWVHREEAHGVAKPNCGLESCYYFSSRF